MLACTGPVPEDPGWAFEFTWDGIRSLADVQPDRLRLLGAHDRGISGSYPELDVLPALTDRRMLLDGKIVALDACGRPSFSRLQPRMNVQRPSATVRRQVPVAYYVFDLLRLDDRCTLQLPYRRRRELLEELDLARGPVVLPPCFLEAEGQAVLDTAAEYGLHGVIAKRADSTYQPGRRSRSWVETAVRRSQEVVVGGWVPSKRGPAGTLGALLMGVPTERGLRYVGRVGTGLTSATRRNLLELLADLARNTSPFLDQVPQEAARAVHWVAPELLGEVAYRQWTAHGRLAHPTWRGLRHGMHPAAIQAPVVLGAAAAVPRADERELAELDEALRRARGDVDALRTQLAPHFLYNALTTIAALVRTDPHRARELLVVFAGFTRYCFRSDPDTTLGDELDNVERYLTLEQARLDERLQVMLQVEPAVLAVELPSLVVQLVVENAVRRGVEAKPGGGTVTISAIDAGDDCVITVTDDGPGTEGDDVAAGSAAGGLATADDRLRAAFGDDHRLVVGAVAGAGTTVRLRVPKFCPRGNHGNRRSARPS
ncbi:MAG: non-homologous end-joining DNA ligase [Actinomycetota bacterium]|nr:non-homologous end-joining DNA ligase [Actinomycetota bacterium]